MKKAIILLFFTFSTIAAATDYYISSSGSDLLNNGLSSTTPWQTIAKVNSSFSTFKPGDRILLNRGDTFYGTLKISKSGLAGSPITISAYGTGEKPIITGFTSITTWKDEGKGIFSSIISCQSAPEMIIIDGIQYGIGRYPNGTWLTVDSHSGDVSITDADLNASSTNWTGADIVQRKPSLFTIDKYKITNHINRTLTYSGSGYHPPSDGYGYFIQNDIKTLDAMGEWYYDGKSLFIYFGTNNPANYSVSVSTIDDLITINPGNNYIIFDNLSINGANNTAIYCYQNEYITISNCNIDFSGNYGIRGTASKNLTITNATINHSNTNGIYMDAYCHNSYISDNIIRNSGLIPGLGVSDFYSCIGICVYQCDNTIIENNQILNSGFNGILFGGNGFIVKNNFINRSCLIKEDGGGIYYGDQLAGFNLTISDNIILNSLGSLGGKPIDGPIYAAGIYTDFKTINGVVITNNTITNCYWGIFLHSNQNVEVKNNTVFNSHDCLRMQEYIGSGYPIRKITMTGNILFAKDALQLPLVLISSNNDFDQFGLFDNNYYAKPIDNSKPIRPLINWSGTLKTLSEWQTLYGHDANSHISPIALTDTADIDFFYNETKTDKVIKLIQPMIDVKGTQYLNSVTLAPFTSIILIVDPNPPVPVVPVYISSVIQNSTPTKLEITYSVNLDPGKVPSVNDFLVKGTTRSVTAVTISGTKVTLTLSGTIAFGQVITLSYSPGTNPLQTPSLGKAISLIDQAVTNGMVDPTVPNDPPIVDIKNKNSGYSGFVYEIDASGTADANNDILTFDWTIPANVPVSSTTGSKIRFLAPVVSSSQNFDFLLNVNDGRVNVSKSVMINISPYKPELDAARITIISASGSEPPDTPDNVNDDNLTTKWSVNGDNQWLLFKLVGSYKISHLTVAFLSGQKYESYFDIYASINNVTWDPILIKAVSCNFSGDKQVFDFPEAKTGTEYLYIKLIGHGNSLNTLNTISELKIFGLLSGNPGSFNSENKNVVIYPNPAQDFFKISIKEPTMRPDKVRLIDSSGRIVFEGLLESEIINVQIPAFIKSGVYIVELRSGTLILDAQKLVINKYVTN